MRIGLFTFLLSLLFNYDTIAQWIQVDGFPSTMGACSIVLNNDTMIVSHTGNANDMDAGLFYSMDNGLTWSSKNTSLGHEADPLIEKNGVLYAASFSNGLFKSNDNGVSWIDLNEGLPENRQILNLVVDDYGIFACGSGIYYLGYEDSVWTCLITEGNGQSRTVWNEEGLTLASFKDESRDGVYKSVDEGESWTLIDSTVGMNDSWIQFFLRFNENIIAAAFPDMGTGSLYVSSDDGDNWEKAEGLDDQGFNYANCSVVTDSSIYLGTSKGVYKSNDSGFNWEYVGMVNVQSMLLVGDTLFAGTGYDGLWKCELSSLATGIEQNDFLESKVNIYPNPFCDKISIEITYELNNGDVDVYLYDLQGRQVKRIQLSDEKCILETSDLMNGIYLLVLKERDKILLTQKIVK